MTRHLNGGGPVSCAVARAALSLLLLRSTGPAYAQEMPAALSPEPPQVLFGELYTAVQNSGIFADSKAFADALPAAAPAEILARYRESTPASIEALKAFVEAYFRLPPQSGAAIDSSERVAIASHIDMLWDHLTRSTATAPAYSSLLPLPEPYVVPGGRFRELYYWDSYFTMLGLVASGRRDLAEGMVRDFAYLIDTYGHVPNGTRSYYLSRSQPPFFYAMVGLLAGDDPAAGYARYLPQLRREYDFWMQGAEGLRRGQVHRRVVAMANGAILNRYWDDLDTPRDESYREDTQLAGRGGRAPQQLYRDLRAAAESGWDFSSRWFADANTLASIRTTEIIPIDLNSLLFGLENAISAGCMHAGHRACAREFHHRAAVRRAAVNRYLWDGAAGVYRDYYWTQQAQVPRLSAATLYPLYAALASQSQAAAVARTTARELLNRGGIAATPVVTGQQWDAPNGWAPLQWIGVAGLRRYAIFPLAQSIACRWMKNVNRVYGESGKLVEKYDVVATERAGGGGEYPLQDGFGWTNGVMRKLMELYPQETGVRSFEPCPATCCVADAPRMDRADDH